MDFRLLPDGAAKYIHVVGHPVVNGSGDVIELVGTAMDVTEQHESRAALQAAFEQIKAEETELRRMTDAICHYAKAARTHLGTVASRDRGELPVHELRHMGVYGRVQTRL